MHVSAKSDYAIRIAAELAGGPAKGDALAVRQGIPLRVMEPVLGELRRAGIVGSRRGPDGGYWLTRPPAQISVADIVRAIDGPLASVRGERPEDVTYPGAAQPLQQVWLAMRVNLRAVLERVSIADIAAGALPDFVAELIAEPAAWQRRE